MLPERHMSDQIDREANATILLKADLKRKGVTCAQLGDMLGSMGIS